MVEQKATQENFSQKDAVTGENILEKRAEIREFYEKQRAFSGQAIRKNLRNQQSLNPKKCEFCGKRGHEMKVCHAYTRQPSRPRHLYADFQSSQSIL